MGQLADELVVVRDLGRGAHTRISLARHPKTLALYCRKSVLAGAPNFQSQLRQLRSEYDVGHDNRHPALRQTLEFGLVRRFFRVAEAYVILQYVDGTPLVEYGPRATLDRLVRIFWHVADGLVDLHHRGFVHADLKPHNILITADERPVLIDFGQSCPIWHSKARIQGTADFIAPEQVSCEPLDPRTDVFGLGATMHLVLLGKPVTTELNATSVRKGGRITLDRRSAEPAAEPRTLDPALKKLIDDSLLPDRAARPANMTAVRDRLELCLRRPQRTA
ncbi:MAG: protein kinase [Phycisphaerae bacterium]